MEALALLEEHPDIKIVITDYNMPEMDGFELTSQIRKTHSVGQLSIIGISAHGGSVLSAKFLKKGANDFLIKPFSNEEFFWRANQINQTERNGCGHSHPTCDPVHPWTQA
jgi:PleD family two-component response regulator